MHYYIAVLQTKGNKFDGYRYIKVVSSNPNVEISAEMARRSAYKYIHQEEPEYDDLMHSTMIIRVENIAAITS